MSPDGKEASSRTGAPFYVRHRPERTLLYQIVDEYYPAFKQQLEAQEAYLPGDVELDIFRRNTYVGDEKLTLLRPFQHARIYAGCFICPGIHRQRIVSERKTAVYLGFQFIGSFKTVSGENHL